MTELSIRRLRPLQALLCLLGLVFLWPGFVNGAPFVFSDTTSYVRGANAIAERILHRPSEWSNAEVNAPASAADKAARASTGILPTKTVAAKPVLLGRSIFYGALLYTGILGKSFWIPVLLQALLSGACLVGALRHFVDPANEPRFARAALLIFAVAALTPLPFFICFLMPDLFTGLGILAALMLIGGWRRETVPGRLGWLAVGAIAALMHSSTVLLLGAIGGGLGAVALLRGNRPALLASALVIGCSVVGYAGEKAFEVAVAKVTGQPPIRPPFLTARLVDDGAGTRYVDENCGSVPAPFYLCDFRDRLPTYSDDFLWSFDPAKGVFSTLEPAEQRRLADEQGRFGLAVVSRYPLDVARGVAWNMGQQLIRVRLDEFNYAKIQSVYLAGKVPMPFRQQMVDSLAFTKRMPVLVPNLISYALILAGIVASGWLWLRRPVWRTYIGGLFLALLTNDFICAALSTPHDRYQTRAIWLFPVIAAAILLPLGRGVTAARKTGEAATSAA